MGCSPAWLDCHSNSKTWDLLVTKSDVWITFDLLRQRDPGSLTSDERLVLAFGEIRTEVNHGGFDSYLRYLCRQNAPIAVVAARVADCPAFADLIDEAIALVGRDVLDGDDEVLYRRLEELEADLRDLDQRFYELENTADLDTAQGQLL